ncbi:ribose-phosphate diphosphokinase [Candidatus Gracilibacteria bacterium]|nr:ribose-phosphate diphosphokinase [Candidatus Gracilibacteria bacterium]
MTSKPNENLLRRFVKGKEIQTGLHLIATPDTKQLVDSVVSKVQRLLDLAVENGPSVNKKEKVTYEVLPQYTQFPTEEMISKLKKSVRGKKVFFFSDPNGDYQPEGKQKLSLNDKFMHDLLTLSAIRLHGAHKTNMIIPCLPYARQDDMTPKERQPASLQVIAEMISKYTGKEGYVMTEDIHNKATTSSALKDTKYINLYTGWFIEECINRMNKEEIILSSADQGGDKKISAIAKEKSLKNIIVLKTRDYSKQSEGDSTVEDINVFGDVEGKDILIHDDMLDTGGTMCKLIKELLKKKPKSINVATTHGMFNGKALEKLQKVKDESEGIFGKIYITNSINKKGLPDFIETIDISTIIANNIVRIYKGLGVDRNDNIDYTKEREE